MKYTNSGQFKSVTFKKSHIGRKILTLTNCKGVQKNTVHVKSQDVSQKPLLENKRKERENSYQKLKRSL